MSEHVILAGRRCACLLIGTRQRLGHLLHQPTPRLPKIVHRTRLDHGLESAPIDLVMLDTATELSQGRIRAMRLAFGDQRFDGRPANTLDCAKTVKNRLLVGDAERVTGAVYIRPDQRKLLLAAVIL